MDNSFFVDLSFTLSDYLLLGAPQGYLLRTVHPTFFYAVFGKCDSVELGDQVTG